MNLEINKENTENKLQNLIDKFTKYKDELKDIEKFVIDQLEDKNDSIKEFRVDMFARHYGEAFIYSRLFSNIESAIKVENSKELNTLIYEVEKLMNFFRMFKNKNWRPVT